MTTDYSGFINHPSPTHGPPAVSQPAPAYRAVTPDDNTQLPSGCRALYIGTTGTVVTQDIAGNVAVAFVGASAGQIIPIQVKIVLATGTTASNIVALY